MARKDQAATQNAGTGLGRLGLVKLWLFCFDGPVHVLLTRFQPHLRLVSQPVLREPRSPNALRHCIANWPRTLLRSPEGSFGKSSSLASAPACISSKNATWMTSRGFSTGALICPVPGEGMSQFSDMDLKGGFGLTLTAYSRLDQNQKRHAERFQYPDGFRCIDVQNRNVEHSAHAALCLANGG